MTTLDASASSSCHPVLQNWLPCWHRWWWLTRGLGLGLIWALAAVTMVSPHGAVVLRSHRRPIRHRKNPRLSQRAAPRLPLLWARPECRMRNSAGQLCDLIREVQTDLGTDALDPAYLAQYTIGLTNFLVDEDSVSKFRTKGDALAKEECPSEHSMFLIGQDQIPCPTLRLRPTCSALKPRADSLAVSSQHRRGVMGRARRLVALSVEKPQRRAGQSDRPQRLVFDIDE